MHAKHSSIVTMDIRLASMPLPSLASPVEGFTRQPPTTARARNTKSLGGFQSAYKILETLQEVENTQYREYVILSLKLWW